MINIVLIAISVFMFYRVIKLSGRGKLNKQMLAVLDQFDDRDAFFEQAETFIAEQKDPEYVQKMKVLRLWGDAFYERDEEYKEHLADIDFSALLNPDGKNKGYSANEDSFFYMYLALPNRFYYRRRNDLRSLLDEKLKECEEANRDALLETIYHENQKFYDRTDDFGKAFITRLLDGEYGGYRYSKQLIGLYKHCEEAILAVLRKEEGDEAGFQECMESLKSFAENTRLGKRWTKELGIELPKEESAEAETETETETAEVSEPAESAEQDSGE